jgi:glycosyltransferase involved in cell wall biosynthesis
LKIISVTISNILIDARIIKTVTAFSKSHKVKEYYGIGVEDYKEKHYYDKTLKLPLTNIVLWSQKIRLSKKIRRPLLFIESNIRFFVLFIKYNPDIVHVNDYHLLLSAVLYKFFKRNKIIYDAHELESKTFGISSMMSKTIHLIEKVSWRHLNYLITVSQLVAEWYWTNLGFKRTEIIRNSPIISEENDFFYTTLREKFAIKENELIFIYIGILNEGRGIDIILEVFTNKGIKSHLVFLGYGPYESKIKSIADLYKNIHLHEPVPYIYVIEIARTADYGLVLIENASLSAYFTAPNKLFEYAFSGIPVIASNFPEMAKIVKDYSLGFLIEPDSSNLNNLVKELELSDKYRIDRKSLMDLSWKSQEAKLLKIIDELN